MFVASRNVRLSGVDYYKGDTIPDDVLDAKTAQKLAARGLIEGAGLPAPLTAREQLIEEREKELQQAPPEPTIKEVPIDAITLTHKGATVTITAAQVQQTITALGTPVDKIAEAVAPITSLDVLMLLAETDSRKGAQTEYKARANAIMAAQTPPPPQE